MPIATIPALAAWTAHPERPHSPFLRCVGRSLAPCVSTYRLWMTHAPRALDSSLGYHRGRGCECNARTLTAGGGLERADAAGVRLAGPGAVSDARSHQHQAAIYGDGAAASLAPKGGASLPPSSCSAIESWPSWWDSRLLQARSWIKPFKGHTSWWSALGSQVIVPVAWQLR